MTTTQNTEETMHRLGQIARVVFKDAAIPPNILTMLLSKPAAGFGMLMRSIEGQRATDPNNKSHDYRMAHLSAKLPPELPPGPIGVEAQGPFWLGYYQTLPRPVNRDIEGLREAGEALYGPTWQTALAQALNIADARRVRAWLSGERRIPPGVWDDIKRLLQERANNAQAVAGGLGDSDVIG